MVNTVPDSLKRLWNQLDGFITWDGGLNKSFRISYKLPVGIHDSLLKYRRGDEFRAPIYITNGRHITIKNCIIEDGLNQSRSKHWLLSGNSYSGANLNWVKDYEDYVGNYNKTYSAGIVIRSLPPYQTRFQDNILKLDTLQCHHITISGNEITQFSYGIANIGLNYRLSSGPFKIDTRDTLYNINKYDLDNNKDLILRNTVSHTDNDGIINRLSYYQERVSNNPRGLRFYLLHERLAGSTTTYFVTILDSALAGVRRFFNYENIVENNTIYDIGRAGIFFGNDENSIIRGNRIHGITGDVVEYVSNTVLRSVDVDCAGIMLGGMQRDVSVLVDGFQIIGTEIYKNEISNIASRRSVSGIKIEQIMQKDAISATFIPFPDCYERMKIYSNII